MTKPDRLEDFINECRRQVAEEAVDSALQIYDNHFLELSARCQSPIEKLLLAALVAGQNSWGFAGPGGVDLVFCRTDRTDPPACPWECVMISAQSQIGAYRADFLIDIHLKSGDKVIVVECDGHDFHEKTKLQAAHDKRRDRAMIYSGAQVLRFTGSEIWADPAACAEEIYDLVADIISADIKKSRGTRSGSPQ